MYPLMNAFKAGLINSQCRNHFPFTQLTQCHWLQTVDVQDRSWSCTPCSSAASRAVPPHTSARPLEPAVYRWHTLPQHAPVRSRHCAALRVIAQHNDVSKYQIRSAIPASFTARGSVGAEYWR